VPTRVQFGRPEPSPYSQTAAPYYEWSRETVPVPLAEVIEAWGLKPQPSVQKAPATSDAGGISPSDFNDDIPF